MHFTDVINLVSVIIYWVYLYGAGCPVGSNHFVGEFLCVEVPVRVELYSGYSLEMSLVLGARLCCGGNVTFRGIQVTREHFIH